MAKKKQGKTARRAGDPAKLPKRIAGVKVPKELRAPGGRLLAAMSNPVVIDAAAAALAAAAGRLATTRSPVARPQTPRDLGSMLAAAALEGVRRLGDTRPNPPGAEAPPSTPKA